MGAIMEATALVPTPALALVDGVVPQLDVPLV